MRGIIVLSALVACLGSAQGYGSGAPKDACDDMVPQHHTPPQTTPFPYSLNVAGNKKVVRAGEKVSLKIIPAQASVTDFQGFLVQARVGETPVGKFIASPDVKVIDCGTAKGNAATHSSAKVKNEVTIQWTAPPSLSEQVTFYVTVAKNGGEFWVKQATQTITVKK